MIRRDVPAAGNQPRRWALIPQIEHAHLSGRLAEHWGGGPFAPLRPRDELVWAVGHHDDGWRNWDGAPDVNPETGVPRSFTEMPIGEAVTIWSGSIEQAAAAGPLQGHLVAGHFCALARRSAAWHRSEPDWPRMEAFLDQYEARARGWLEAWQQARPPANTSQLAQRALAQLQFFDALSLWFCCAEASGPDTVDTPAGVELTLVPQTPGRLRLSPWPLTVERLNLEVRARLVPVAAYPSRAQLAAAPAEDAVLRWELQP